MNFLDLINKGEHIAIMDYVRTCKVLSVEEEVALVERGNHQEIMAYIAEHYFEPDAGLDAFKKRGNIEEIRFYIYRQDAGWFDEAYLLKFKHNISDAIVDYLLKKEQDTYYTDTAGKLQKYSNLGDESPTEVIPQMEYWQRLLIKLEDHIAIRRYMLCTNCHATWRQRVSCTDVWMPKALALFFASANPEDTLTYELVSSHLKDTAKD